jgi:DNA-binding NtrC family response regulator
MPIMNGEDCFAKLREIDPNIKILISSGFSKRGKIAELQKHPNVEFIKKPFQVKEFSNKVAGMFNL